MEKARTLDKVLDKMVPLAEQKKKLREELTEILKSSDSKKVEINGRTYTLLQRKRKPALNLKFLHAQAQDFQDRDTCLQFIKHLQQRQKELATDCVALKISKQQ
jgi:hypothetical protein